ncbi:hypothetical protein [Stenotrophomonas sp. Y-13]|uniref:hypothetical protein n=1 Tax=Stenotrophomonas sp. Y-13 TaxID=3384161 RepID=UPI003916E343
MSYYKTNAVYNALSAEQSHPFVWVSGNAWMLIYGDQSATPRALVLAFGNSWSLQKDVIQTAKKISSKSGIPLFFVKFDDGANSIDKVGFGRPGQQPCELTLDQLKDEFQKIGLPVKSGACGKSVNDATSSAYHNWQRSSLGSIKVTDIDLIRLSTDGEPIEAIELKRSFSPLQEWNPYPVDYVNFNLLLAVCNQSAMRMTLAYNVRQTKPVFNDDASRFALFSYVTTNSPVRIGQFNYSDFLAGIY